MFKIYFLIALFFIITLKPTTARTTPVLIWGAKLPVRPVFPKISKDEFKELMEKSTESKTTFLVLQENFEARQLSCRKSANQQCFNDFPNDEYTFYGSVENPKEALEELFSETAELLVNEQGKLEARKLCEEGSYRTLNVLKPAEIFTKGLTMLDLKTKIISNIMEKLQNCARKPLVLFADTMNVDIEYENEDGNLNMLLVKGMSTTISDGIVTVDVATRGHEMFDYSNEDVKNITFKIYEKPGQFTMINASYDDEEYSGKTLKWPRVFSVNEPGLVFTNGNKKLRINKRQLERFAKADKDLKPKKNRTEWNTCVYVTPGILMGIFVMTIIGAIMFCGLTMIMDIQTNDRFDGPKMQALQFANIDN